MSIAMSGGGTGGHLTIIKAVKEHLKSEELIYIGSTSGQDRKWFGEDEQFSAKYFLPTRGVVNQGLVGKIKSLWLLLKATIKAIKILKKHKASVVFSVGGFSSAPSAFASKILRIPLVIHEQNASIGSLNRLLKPYSHTFISSYLDESPIKAYPIKDIFFQNAHIREDISTIIFLGGSQGARAINNLALDLAPTLRDRGIKILHQAGENNIDEVKKAYLELGVRADVFGFTTNLDEYMNEADLAIARSGASTLWELSATALPSIFIPYPYASSDHQYHNAKFLVDRELAWVMREDKVDSDKILDILDRDLSKMSQGLMDIVEVDGSLKIAKVLTQI